MSQSNSPFLRALAAGIRANVPTLIWGGPGQAKTATITAAAEAWDLHLETIIGSTREATDFLGVMVENNGEVSYSSFGWMNRLNDTKRTGGLVFLDEFNTAGPATMKGQLRFIQERQVGEQRLNDNVAIVAAANPTDIAVDGYDLPAPMANRFMHLDWVFDAKYWLQNVTTGFNQDPVEPLDLILNANPDVRRAAVGGSVAAFLHAKPALLTPEVPDDVVKAGRAWASPRSWTNVISVLSHLEADDISAAMLVVSGLVGEGAAKEYFKWVAAQDLYDPREVMNNPSIVDWKSRPDRIFSLVQSITALGLLDENDWRPAAKVLTVCAQAGRADVAAGGAQRLGNALPKGQKMPQQFLDAFTGLFTKTLHRVSA
jgi:MoxR-like ATPase